jgi:hypothetical protein
MKAILLLVLFALAPAHAADAAELLRFSEAEKVKP